ncbi:hypothetical protein PG999_005520 [Apiospora kogelbergensis]|uniref:C2H2-type domain-containing protein n=1 Tax=Apiospora kogelbergensis TaxID=1337665 RepID=A0AAW0R2G7_9PEZI
MCTYADSNNDDEERPHLVIREEFNQYTQPDTVSSGPSPPEVANTSPAHDIPMLDSLEMRSELVGEGSLQPQSFPGVPFHDPDVGNVGFAPPESHMAPTTHVPCVYELSTGKLSTYNLFDADVDASLSPERHLLPSKDGIGMSAIPMGGLPTDVFTIHSAKFESPSARLHNRNRRWSIQSSDDSIAEGYKKPAIQVTSGSSFQSRRAETCAERRTPTLSLNIPSYSAQTKYWGPYFADLTLIERGVPTNPFPRTKSASTEYAQNSSSRRLKETSKSMSLRSTLSRLPSGETHSSPVSGDGIKQSVPTTDLQCPECGWFPQGNSAKAAKNLQKHQSTHVGNRWSCEHCSKTYSRKDNATTHLQKCHDVSGLETSSPANDAGRKIERSGNNDKLSFPRKIPKAAVNSG